MLCKDHLNAKKANRRNSSISVKSQMLLTIEFSAAPVHIDTYQFGGSAIGKKSYMY